jgi:hypothetical protein
MRLFITFGWLCTAAWTLIFYQSLRGELRAILYFLKKNYFKILQIFQRNICLYNMRIQFGQMPTTFYSAQGFAV